MKLFWIFLILALIDIQSAAQGRQNLHYSFHYKNNSTVLLGQLSLPNNNAAEKAFQIAITGSLILSVPSVQDSNFEIIGRILNPHVELLINNKTEPKFDAQALRSLGPFTIVMNRDDGKIVRIHLPSNAHPLAKNFLLALLSPLQVSRNNGKNEVWLGEEHDSNGVFRTRYERLPSPNSQSASLSKTKLQYLEVGSRGLQIVPNENSKAIITVDTSSNYIRSLFLHEELSFLANEHPQAKSTTDVSLALVKTISVQKTVKLLPSKRYLAVKLFEKLSTQSLAIEKQELGGETSASLFRKLAEFEKSTQAIDQQKVTSLYLKWKALISLQPKSCREILRSLNVASHSSLAFNLLVPALAETGNVQSQKTLLKLLSSREADAEFQQILLAYMGQIRFPRPETVNAVLKIINSTKNNQTRTIAILGLGNLVKNLPTDRLNAVASQVEKLLSTEDKSERHRRLFLAFLGNAAVANRVETVSRAACSELAETRISAANALRMIQTPDAQKVLFHLMADGVVAVRSEALTALSYHFVTSDIVHSLQTRLPNETSSDLKVKVIEILGRAAKSFPEAKDTLLNVANQETDTKIKEAAEKALKY